MINIKKCQYYVLSAATLATTVLTPVVSAQTTNFNIASMKPTVAVATDATSLFQRVMTLIIVVGALLALYYLMMGAIGWITSDGEASKVEAARNKMLYAVVGLLVLASVWAIYRLVLTISFGTDNIAMPTLKS